MELGCQMTKYIIPLLATALIANAATNEFDMVKGIDLTGQTAITASQLNQLVDNARTATNKGMIFAYPYTPDTTNNTRYTNFIWLDTSFQPPRLKVWTQMSNRWDELSVTNVTIGSGVITSANIANGTITSEDIADGTISSVDLSTGIITSNYLAGDAVRTANIADDQVTAAKVADGAIDSSDKIAAGILIRTDFANDAVGGNVVSNYGIDSLKIATNAVHDFNLTNGAVTFSKLADNSVSNNAIINNSITTNKFDTNILNVLPITYVNWNNSILQSKNISVVSNYANGTIITWFTTPYATSNYCAIVSQRDNLAASEGQSIQTVSNKTDSVTVLTKDGEGGDLEAINGGFNLLIIGY